MQLKAGAMSNKQKIYVRMCKGIVLDWSQDIGLSAINLKGTFRWVLELRWVILAKHKKSHLRFKPQVAFLKT
jgi:hypothetical protein